MSEPREALRQRLLAHQETIVEDREVLRQRLLVEQTKRETLRESLLACQETIIEDREALRQRLLAHQTKMLQERTTLNIILRSHQVKADEDLTKEKEDSKKHRGLASTYMSRWSHYTHDTNEFTQGLKSVLNGLHSTHASISKVADLPRLVGRLENVKEPEPTEQNRLCPDLAPQFAEYNHQQNLVREDRHRTEMCGYYELNLRKVILNSSKFPINLSDDTTVTCMFSRVYLETICDAVDAINAEFPDSTWMYYVDPTERSFYTPLMLERRRRDAVDVKEEPLVFAESPKKVNFPVKDLCEETILVAEICERPVKVKPCCCVIS